MHNQSSRLIKIMASDRINKMYFRTVGCENVSFTNNRIIMNNTFTKFLLHIQMIRFNQRCCSCALCVWVEFIGTWKEKLAERGRLASRLKISSKWLIWRILARPRLKFYLTSANVGQWRIIIRHFIRHLSAKFGVSWQTLRDSFFLRVPNWQTLCIFKMSVINPSLTDTSDNWFCVCQIIQTSTNVRGCFW